jgi:hypothetical protein
LKKITYIALLVFCSCGTNTNNNDYPQGLIDVLDTNHLGDIHGTSIGDDIEYVMKKMKPHIVSEMPDELTARIPLSIKDSTFYDINYDFKNGELYSIDLDIFPKDFSDCNLLYNEFKKYYNRAYGEGIEDEGYIVWYTETKSGDDIEISLIDESYSNYKPYLAVTFYQEDGIAD